ncbi:hypothetical protein E8E11_006316 [Didymella keratinophila]|nr:hypothetical protein E8E11_006316 [Didymella keratinophila]
MEDVFSEAYCVIVATAASDPNSGFLGNYTKVESFRIHGVLYGQFCVSSDVEDHDQDVSNATINTRAWVMQESVLARRIIHFTSNQMYWERGEAIYYENLLRLKSPPRGKYFTMNPEFPTRVLSAINYTSIVHCLVTLYEDYSK